jgi:hypothetical protein
LDYDAAIAKDALSETLKKITPWRQLEHGSSKAQQ